jgi:hypothetical protein
LTGSSSFCSWGGRLQRIDLEFKVLVQTDLQALPGVQDGLPFLLWKDLVGHGSFRGRPVGIEFEDALQLGKAPARPWDHADREIHEIKMIVPEQARNIWGHFQFEIVE